MDSKLILMKDALLLHKSYTQLRIHQNVYYERNKVLGVDPDDKPSTFYDEIQSTVPIKIFDEAQSTLKNRTSDLIKQIGKHDDKSFELVFENKSDETLSYLVLDKHGKTIKKFDIKANSEKTEISPIGTPWLIKRTSTDQIIALYHEALVNQVTSNVKIITDNRFDTEGERLLDLNKEDKIKIKENFTSITYTGPSNTYFAEATLISYKENIYYEKKNDIGKRRNFKAGQVVFLPRGTKIQLRTSSTVTY